MPSFLSAHLTAIGRALGAARARRLLNLALIGGFLLLLLRHALVKGVPDFTDAELTWKLSDWLIDYSAGFVRRGLGGTVLELLAPVLNPYVGGALLAWGLMLAVLAGWLRLLLRARDQLSPLTMLGLLFLPSLLPFYFYDHEAFGRKEVLGLVLLLWHLFVIERSFIAQRFAVDRQRYLRGLAPIALIGLPLSALIHEGIIFMSGPVHGLVTLTVLQARPGMPRVGELWSALVWYLPVLATTLAIVLWGDATPAMAEAICRNWEQRGLAPPGTCVPVDPWNLEAICGRWAHWTVVPPGGCLLLDSAGTEFLPGALISLGWSLADGVLVTRLVSYNSGAFPLWLLDFAVLGPATLIVVGMVIQSLARGAPSTSFLDWARQPAAGMAVRFALIPLLLSLPLYVIAVDLGRWFAMLCINFAMVGLSRELVAIAGHRLGVQPAPAPVAVGPTWLGIERAMLVNTGALLAVLLLLRMPHCCPSLDRVLPWMGLFSG